MRELRHPQILPRLNTLPSQTGNFGWFEKAPAATPSQPGLFPSRESDRRARDVCFPSIADVRTAANLATWAGASLQDAASTRLLWEKWRLGTDPWSHLHCRDFGRAAPPSVDDSQWAAHGHHSKSRRSCRARRSSTLLLGADRTVSRVRRDVHLLLRQAGTRCIAGWSVACPWQERSPIQGGVFVPRDRAEVGNRSAATQRGRR